MTDTAQHYLSAFKARTACCRALIELSLRQQRFVDADDYQGLIELLMHKQQLVDELLSPGADGQNFWQGWREVRSSLTAGERQRCEAVLDEANTLLQQLLPLEAGSEQELLTRREQTLRAMADLNLGRVAAQEYQTPVESVVSRRLDFDL